MRPCICGMGTVEWIVPLFPLLCCRCHVTRPAILEGLALGTFQEADVLVYTMLVCQAEDRPMAGVANSHTKWHFGLVPCHCWADYYSSAKLFSFNFHNNVLRDTVMATEKEAQQM